MTNPISGLRILPVEAEAVLGSARETSGGFAQTLKAALSEADQLQGQATQEVSGLLQGSGHDVHSALIAVEKADLSFQLMLQVRNKIVQAYQEVSRLQF